MFLLRPCGPSARQLEQRSFCDVPRFRLCSVVDPLQVVGHSGVDAVVTRSGAALPPADDSQQEHCLLVVRHQGPAAVAFTRVLAALDVSGTEHVSCEDHAALLHTLLRPDPWHLQAPQDVRGGPELPPPPPAAHRVQTDGPEVTLGERARRQAGRDGVGSVGDGRGQAEEGDVVVGRLRDVVLVHDDLHHLDELLCALSRLSVVFACQTKSRVDRSITPGF